MRSKPLLVPPYSALGLRLPKTPPVAASTPAPADEAIRVQDSEEDVASGLQGGHSEIEKLLSKPQGVTRHIYPNPKWVFFTT